MKPQVPRAAAVAAGDPPAAGGGGGRAAKAADRARVGLAWRLARGGRPPCRRACEDRS